MAVSAKNKRKYLFAFEAVCMSYNEIHTTEKFITKDSLCEFFSVSERTVWRWLREGCPCVRIGAGGRGDARFRASDVEAWLNNRSEVAKR